MAGVFAKFEEDCHEVCVPAAQGFSFDVDGDGPQAFDLVYGLDFWRGGVGTRGSRVSGARGRGGVVVQSPTGHGSKETSHL